MPDGSYKHRHRRRRNVASARSLRASISGVQCSGSLIAATPPVDRQEKSLCTDKDSPSARRDSFCESAFPMLHREPMLCLRQRASPAKGALKSMYRLVSGGSLTLSLRLCQFTVDISLAKKLI